MKKRKIDMPKINNNAQRNAAAQGDNFLNTNSQEYWKVNRLAQSLDRLADTLAADEKTAALGIELKAYAGAIKIVQGGDDSYSEAKVDKAISDVTLKLGGFLKAGEGKSNYRTIVEAGEKTGLLSQKQLDEGLGLIGDTMGVELEPGEPELEEVVEVEQAQPNVQQEAQPQAQKAQPAKSYDDALFGALAVQLMDAIKNGDIAAQALDGMIEALEQSPRNGEKEVGAVLSDAKRFRQECDNHLAKMDEKEVVGDYFDPGRIGFNLRKNLKALQAKDPDLFGQLCGQFVETMRQTDFSPMEARYKTLDQINNQAYAEEKKQIKAAKAEANAKKVHLYEEGVELTENSIAHYIDKVRNEIVESEGFKKDPPEIDPRQLVTLQMLMSSGGESGEMHTAKGADYLANMQSIIDLQMQGEARLFEEMAKDPKIHQVLREREPHKCWFDSTSVKFMKELGEFDARYEPNLAGEGIEKTGNIKKTRKTVEAALEVYRTEAGTLLKDGNPYVQNMADAVFKIQKENYRSKASKNLQLRDMGMDFLGSLSAADLQNTDGARECAAATLSVMAVLLPPEDVQKGCDLINKKLGLDHTNKDFFMADKVAPGFEEGMTALTYIDNCKSGIVNNETARIAAADIFAARIAVDTKGGKAKYLNKPLSDTQRARIAEDLNKNEHFQDWLKNLDKDKAKSLLSGHGGALERDFRQHLLKTAPGKLANDPVLRRYMPTAKDRIEELQKQVKNAAKQRLPEEQLKDLRAAAAAEIIAIRNACRVERKTGYGLNKPIPPAAPGQRTIAQTAAFLCADGDMKGLLNEQALVSLASGHGGKMMKDVRRLYSGMQRKPEIAEVINKNTVNSRLLALEGEADALKKKLTSQNKAEREAAQEQSRRVLGEYIYLNRMPEDKLGNDMVWKNAEGAAGSGERSRLIQVVTESPENAERAMDAVSQKNNAIFSQLLIDKKNEGKLRDADLNPQAMEEQKRQRMRQQNHPEVTNQLERDNSDGLIY